MKKFIYYLVLSVSIVAAMLLLFWLSGYVFNHLLARCALCGGVLFVAVLVWIGSTEEHPNVISYRDGTTIHIYRDGTRITWDCSGHLVRFECADLPASEEEEDTTQRLM